MQQLFTRSNNWKTSDFIISVNIRHKIMAEFSGKSAFDRKAIQYYYTGHTKYQSGLLRNWILKNSESESEVIFEFFAKPESELKFSRSRRYAFQLRDGIVELLQEFVERLQELVELKLKLKDKWSRWKE